jgi:hypothetical protein
VPSDGGSYYGDVIWRDSKKATFGNSNDLQIYHDGSNSYIDDIGTGNLIIGAANFQLMNVAHTENHITATDNGSVDLYYDNSKKFETTSAGISITGNIILPDANPSNNTGTLKLGAGADLQIYHNGVNSFIDNGTGNLTIDAGVHLLLRNATGESLANFYANGSNELFYDNSKKFETTAAGVEVTGGINASGTLDISATYPRINLNDTNHEDDWSIINADGAFTIYNVDDNVNAIHISNVNNVTLGADLTVSGGDITLGGTGRIQGVDTVTNATDAANKAYVDAQVGSADTLQEVTDNGNTTTNSVGIGVTNPSEKLVVNVNAAGIKSALILNNEHGYGSGVGVAAAALQFGRDNSVAGGQTLISGQIYSGNENETTSNPCFMAFSTKSGVSPFSVTERMRIDSSGNIGIGTTSPNNFGFLETALQVSAGSSSSTTLQQAGLVLSGSSDADDADDFAYLAFTNHQSTLSNGRVAEIRAFKNGTNVDTGELAFYTVLQERMRIDASGNVGIGTMSPGTYKLNVAGGGRFSLNVDFANNHGIRGTKTDNSVIKILGLNSSNELVINENASTTVPTRIVGDYITLEPTNFLGAATEAVRIIEGGNVGIGTTSPSAKLEVNAGVANNVTGPAARISKGASPIGLIRYDTLVVEANDVATIRIGESDGTVSTIMSGDSNLRINSTHSIKFSTAGTTTGEAFSGQGGTLALTLDNSQNATFAGDVTVSGGGITLGGTGRIQGVDTVTNATDAANKAYVDAQVGSADTLQEVTDNGNTTTNSVGIGTTNPKSKLDVNGVFCVDSKAHTVTDAFTTCLTVNLDSHAGCHVVITLFGDWSGHSSAAYRGEFFLQNGANGYGEPGIILRQDDNTFTGTDQIICQIVDPTSTANPKDFQIQIRHTDTTSPASWTGQLTYTVQGKFNSIT